MNATTRKQSMSAIVANNKAAGGHFFDRATLRFFNDTPGNWDAFLVPDGTFRPRMFMRNVRHSRGPGMFAGCTLRGQVREVFECGAVIGLPIKALHGLKPRAIARAVWAGEV